jgi:hypothetical protein
MDILLRHVSLCPVFAKKPLALSPSLLKTGSGELEIP